MSSYLTPSSLPPAPHLQQRRNRPPFPTTVTTFLLSLLHFSGFLLPPHASSSLDHPLPLATTNATVVANVALLSNHYPRPFAVLLCPDCALTTTIPYSSLILSTHPHCRRQHRHRPMSFPPASPRRHHQESSTIPTAEPCSPLPLPPSRPITALAGAVLSHYHRRELHHRSAPSSGIISFRPSTPPKPSSSSSFIPHSSTTSWHSHQFPVVFAGSCHRPVAGWQKPLRSGLLVP